MGLINFLWSKYISIPCAEINEFINNPEKTQEDQLMQIIRTAEDTEWGLKYGYRSISSVSDFMNRVPLNEYDEIKSYIFRMMKGEEDVLWPGRVSHFAKSSGTTSDKSKFIPIPSENHRNCHSKAGLHLIASIYNQLPDCSLLDGKSIILAGSCRNDYPEYPGAIIGDVSAVIYKNLSTILKSFLVPSEEFNLLEDSEKKLDIIAEKCIDEDVRLLVGSPTWMLILFRKILALTGKSNMLEVWPHFEILIHGAVSFVPYRNTFKELFPSDNVHFFEAYNASEGYFAFQDKDKTDELLLLLDVGVFYEFISPEQLNLPSPKTLLLGEVQTGINYAVIITTNSGLYRYVLGDTITFTCLKPFRIRITGRIKQFINVFGEELMVATTDEAVRRCSEQFNVRVRDYTVAPVFQEGDQARGGHEWIIEFETEMPDLHAFAESLDQTLQSLNSDYEAKRYKGLALNRLILHLARPGCFSDWMQATNRIGAQKKVPRLSNERIFLEEILQCIK